MISFVKLTILATVYSLATATGHIQLIMTSSNDCQLQLNSDYSESHTLNLTMGEDQTVTFHPMADMDTLELTFSINGTTSQTHSFELEFDGQEQRDVYVFSEIVILVQSIFECDKGFSGYRCQQESSSTPLSTTTISSTTTFSTVSTITTSSRVPIISPTHDALHTESSEINTTMVLFILVVAFLVILIAITGFCIRNRRQSIYIEPEISCESQKSEKDSSFKCRIEIETRYTAEPSNSTFMTQC